MFADVVVKLSSDRPTSEKYQYAGEQHADTFNWRFNSASTPLIGNARARRYVRAAAVIGGVEGGKYVVLNCCWRYNNMVWLLADETIVITLIDSLSDEVVWKSSSDRARLVLSQPGCRTPHRITGPCTSHFSSVVLALATNLLYRISNNTG